MAKGYYASRELKDVVVTWTNSKVYFRLEFDDVKWFALLEKVQMYINNYILYTTNTWAMLIVINLIRWQIAESSCQFNILDFLKFFNIILKWTVGTDRGESIQLRCTLKAAVDSEGSLEKWCHACQVCMYAQHIKTKVCVGLKEDQLGIRITN